MMPFSCRNGSAAVVTCKQEFEGPQFTGTLKFMRVWLKNPNRWQIIAGSISNRAPATARSLITTQLVC